jgi:hypothetical protein
MPRIFYLAYQFESNEESTNRWQTIRHVLEKAEDVSLSAYNMQLLSNQQWCVALVGKPPSDSRQKQLKKLLEGGIQVRLSDGEVVKLTQARLEGVKEGPWVIKHHYPGRYI